MRRRYFLSLLGGAAVSWPLRVRAQQERKVPKIGFLGLRPASSFATRIEALWAGLHQLGYVEGKNLVIEYQWAETVDQLPELAALMVRTKVDLIFAPVSTFVEPARQANENHSHSFCQPRRSHWCRSCGEFSAPRRQYHRSLYASDRTRGQGAGNSA